MTAPLRSQWPAQPHLSSKTSPPIFFTPPRTMNPVTPSKIGGPLFSTPQSTPSRSAGYFAFPPGSPSTSVLSPSFDPPPTHQQDELAEADRKRQAALDEAYAERVARDAALRKSRLEMEAAEAYKGEVDWVRSGGILRDAQGNRDYVRTEAIREELRLRALEKTLTERWTGYEARWTALVGKGGLDRAQYQNIQFGDVPWPTCPEEGQSVALADLTVSKIEEFLLGPLKVRGCTVTKKERVRSSLLRWHPDKMTGILARVVDSDSEAVRQGIHAVVLCLQQLNSRVES
ncbi:hypothetical protein FB45DRAFT_852277 [Roridomyces roridus]|uniref:Uncharacterized protein n=1 Tax=Roridomyces roridus TaxID=1738132 RepID=A0AAD7AXN5_9AGAR|nr:hypothetical protein FB45DRAFT_852277 [Roridomyces roridus]